MEEKKDQMIVMSTEQLKEMMAECVKDAMNGKKFWAKLKSSVPVLSFFLAVFIFVGPLVYESVWGRIAEVNKKAEAIVVLNEKLTADRELTSLKIEGLKNEMNGKFGFVDAQLERIGKQYNEVEKFLISFNDYIRTEKRGR
jgi:hypothetical protein